MNDQDPFELLSSFRGSDADAYLAPGEDPVADALLERIMSSESADRPRRRTPRRRVVTGVLVGVVVGSGAVAAALWLDQPSDPATLSCYSEASTDPDVQVGLTIDPNSTPVEQCAELWRDSTLGSGEPPPLTTCVTRNGITAVLPGDETTCAELGFAGRDPVVAPDEALAARIVGTISERYPTECVDSIETATAIIETILTDLGADDWDVRAAGAIGEDRPCAYAVVNAEEQVVLIVSAAGAPG